MDAGALADVTVAVMAGVEEQPAQDRTALMPIVKTLDAHLKDRGF